MKTVFMGTPHMAIPCLEALLSNDIDVSCVFTQPDKPKRQRRQSSPPPIKEFALERGLKVYQPPKIKGNEEIIEILNGYAPDFLVVVAYGKILPLDILSVPKFASINVHYSLLPLLRGASPVNFAIVDGHQTTGVTTMIMDEGLDTGDMLLTDEIPINNMNAIELSSFLSDIGAKLLVKTLKEFHSITPKKQNDADATFCSIIKKSDGRIDWSLDAVHIERMIRGFQPWPVAYTHLADKILKLFVAKVVEGSNNVPGTIYDVDGKGFKISCGKGSLYIEELQFEGKKRMTCENFLKGFKFSENNPVCK